MDIRERMLNEAIHRMTLLGLPQDVIDDLRYFDIKAISTHGGKIEDLPDEYQFLIDKFEIDTGCFVYHVIVEQFKNKRFLYLLCVYTDEIDNKENLKTAHELISNPSAFKEKFPVLVVQRMDLYGQTLKKYFEEPFSIKVSPKPNGGLKYIGFAKVPKFNWVIL